MSAARHKTRDPLISAPHSGVEVVDNGAWSKVARLGCLVCSSFLAMGFLGKSFPSPQKPQKDCHRSSEERKTEKAHSFVIDQGIDDSRLDLAS